MTGGSVTGGSVTGGSVTGGSVTGGSVTGGSVSVTGGSVTGGSVTGGAVVGVFCETLDREVVADWEVVEGRELDPPWEVTPFLSDEAGLVVMAGAE